MVEWSITSTVAHQRNDRTRTVRTMYKTGHQVIRTFNNVYIKGYLLTMLERIAAVSRCMSFYIMSCRSISIQVLLL